MARSDLPAPRALWDQRAPMELSDLLGPLAGLRSMLALALPEAWSSPLTRLHPIRPAGENVRKEDIARPWSASCSDTSGPEVLRERSSLSLAACRTQPSGDCVSGSVVRYIDVYMAPSSSMGSPIELGPAIDAYPRPCGRRQGAPRACQAGARTNIRFRFQAMVTRLHSPRTFSSPRSEN